MIILGWAIRIFILIICGLVVCGGIACINWLIDQDMGNDYAFWSKTNLNFFFKCVRVVAIIAAVIGSISGLFALWDLSESMIT